MAGKKVIITGGPGSGKTSLIKALQQRGYTCYDEIARKVIKEQVACGSNKVPWDDMAGFSDLVYLQMLEMKSGFRPNGTCFLDRGMPDILAYLRVNDLPIPKKYYDAIAQYGYHKTVFLAPAWADIYLTDSERKEDFYEAHQLSLQLRAVYEELGFTIHELPMAGINKRVQFMEEHLQEIAV